ncbi:uncharacterized protein [Dysidea avara]|uniref:uncharacterized protein n=1 Tax=Dysidea avara TaxID=196820 RepID=UPI003329FF97
MAEGLASPDYWQIVCDHRDQILALIKETDWVEAKNKHGIRIMYRDTDQGRPGRMFHVEAELDVAPAIARQYFIPGPKGLRDKFQNAIKQFKAIEETDNYIIAHEVIAGNFIVSDRDTVCVYGGEDDSDIGAYLMGPSIEHPDYPCRGKPVRATKHIAGFVFLNVDGDPNKCVLHGVARIDLGGMVPLSIVRSFQPKRLFETISEVKQAIANKLHEKTD